MTQELRAGILSAPLAAIDRRVLSQAWYTALGFARECQNAGGRRGAGIASRGTLPKTARADGAECRAGTRRLAVARGCLTPVSGKRDRAAYAAAADRRASSALARAIERRFARRASMPARATFTLDDGRVHVMLRNCGNDVRLIALCAPRARAAVARALEEARYALAVHGIELRVERIGAKR